MNKKYFKYIGLLIITILVIFAICNIYNWIVCGNQQIKISTSSRAYTNNDLYVSIIAKKDGTNVKTNSKIKLKNSKGKKVKNVKVKYEENNAIISIPDVEPGNYILEAKVSSNAGKDKIQKEIYISNGNNENTTITLDKGIYKPGDAVNYRALLTSKENDEPVIKDVNVCIYDGNENRVYNENLKTSDFGIISGSFTLANEVNSGLYKLVVKSDNNETTKQFKVNPYVTPKYEVKIESDKENYIVGEIAKLNIHAKYFFGEPVENADLKVFVNNENIKNIKSDSNGNASIEYEVKKAGMYNIKIEAVDSSNYFVEENKSFSAGTDIFEIELIPEYGTLIAGQKNNVYVFTNKSDGTPVKTYITASSNSLKKQIATDDNGIGKFQIDVSSEYKQKIYINATDMENNTIKKTVELNVKRQRVLLSTDKVKYEQGEDIKLSVNSSTENSKNIYMFKNDKLIKMITTDSNEITVNLNETYGLIDILVSDDNGTSDINAYKRTIFIKPSKQLNINIAKDKDEYKPGEDIKISFNTKNENQNDVEAALLVSMLDNSILNLANNDLSIDNIKLALQDIKFSNELDGATLYSCIINDSSEQAIMGLLLKQDGNNSNISETQLTNDEQKDKAIIRTIITCLLIVTLVLIYLCIRFKKFRKIIKHTLNFVIFDILITLFINILIEEYFWNIDYSTLGFIVTTILALAVYLGLVSRISKNLTRTSISIFILMLLAILFGILIIELSIPGMILLLIIAILILIIVVSSKIIEVKKIKINKYISFIFKESLYILKFTIILILSCIIGISIEALINIYNISYPIIIIVLYILNYYFNIVGIKELIKSKKSNRVSIKRSILYVLILVVLLVVIIGIGAIFRSSRSVVYDYRPGKNQPFDIRPADIHVNDFNDSLSTSGNTITELFEDMIPSVTGNDKKTNSTEKENTQEKESKTDDNVRNVFLESMCFVPELVTKNGTGSLELNLSDNITTWTIQTIGNTKDGRIGYGSIDNVKVFKEFFVDFELPKNLVENDHVKIPVTVYNYTDNAINTTIKVKEEDWFAIENNNINVSIDAKSSNMIYVPIVINKKGDNKFRVEVSKDSLTDIVEKECTINPRGYKIEKVVSSGNLDQDISENILLLDDMVENTAKAKVKIYASTMSQTIEGMDKIFKMPTGCFEQISSSLYPNILALKYLEDCGINDESIRKKAKTYISTGYQKLLTYEVKGESGGYSLYGDSPAETVLTAYGLMEITDLKEVYDVDDKVIEKMTDFLYKNQNQNGTFKITGSHIGGANSRNNISLNAYITWALSEANPNDSRLDKSIDYLKNEVDKNSDNYTLALIANALANVKDKKANDIVKKLINNVNIENNKAELTSNFEDYYGTRDSIQSLQTVALTSMALSKTSQKDDVNKMLINYIISKKDTRGTWYSTQATILSLKAINESINKSKLENQTVTVKVNSEEQKIEIKDNPLDYYELTFENLNKENSLEIDIEKGNALYEVVEEYYMPYDKVNTKSDNIELIVENDSELKVNDVLKANISAINRSNDIIENGMITISIPQGFTVIEESLMQLESKKIIEKYEMSYTEVNIYLRKFDISQVVNLEVLFRASYPVEITGLSVKAFDYYNPNVEGKAMPREIKVYE